MINNSIFSNGPNGTILLVPDQAVELEGSVALISFLWYLAVPAAVLLFLRSNLFNRIKV